MQLSDVELYRGRPEPLTVVTAAPQTKPGWLIAGLIERFSAQVIELGVTPPKFVPHKEVLVVTHAELPVLAAQLTADELVSQLLNLAKTHSVIVVLTLSDALVDPYYETGKQLARLAVRLLYEASLVVQLQPLKTGRARDITGRFVVAPGPKSVTGVASDLFYHIGVKGAVELRVKQ